MSRFVSVVIRNPRKTKKPTSHNLRHNSRLTPDPNYMLPRELRLKNYNLYTVSDATKTWDEWQTEIGDLYKEQHLKGRQIRSDAVRLEEGLIVLSEEQVDNCNADDIWEKMQEYINWFEERFLTVVYTLDWHRDEGHSEEDLDEVQKLETRNNHAHFIFNNVDSNGDMIRRNWDKKGTEFKEMQDQIAKIFKPLGFVRGVNYAKNKIIPPKYKTPNEKRREKSKETRKKDKTEIKNLTDILNKEKEKKWQQRLKKLRGKMQLEKANRSKYAELETLLKTDAINYKNAEMQNEAIAENVIWDMKVELGQEKQVLEEKITEKVNEFKKLQEKSDVLEESSADLVETKDAKISELQSDITFHQIIDEQRADKVNTLQTEIESHQKSIKDKVTQIEELESASLASETQHKEKIEVKDNEILSLDQQVQELKKEVFSETWTWTSTDGKKYKSKNIDVVKHLESEHKELNEDIETLKTQNNTLATSIEEKETQIALDSNILKGSQEKIKILEKQVQELEDKEPEIIEVIKEVSIELTPEEIMQLVIETEHGFLKIEDMIEKQKEIIVKKSSDIKELKKLAYTGNTYLDSDRPFPYKKRSENQAKKINELEKKIEELDKTAYYDDVDYNKELDKPVSVRTPYSQKVLELQKDKSSLVVEIEELDKFAFYEKDIWIDELEDYVTERFYYKSENKELTKELEKSKEELVLAQKVIETVGKYNIPYKNLKGNIREISDNILNKVWQKRPEKNKIKTPGIKLK